MIYGALMQQKSTLSKIERGELPNTNAINIAVLNQASHKQAPSDVETKLAGLSITETEVEPTKETTQVITMPHKLVPWSAQFESLGFSARVVTLPKEEGTQYRAAVNVSLLGKLYSVRLQVSLQNPSFDRMFHVHNIIPTDSAMALACKAGDFNGARLLLTKGLGHGSDVTASGLPVLDVCACTKDWVILEC